VSRPFDGPNEYDWKGRALRAEAAMDFAARMVTYIMNGSPLTMESWPVEQYMKAIDRNMRESALPMTQFIRMVTG
jgi:hypothetical protein